MEASQCARVCLPAQTYISAQTYFSLQTINSNCTTNDNGPPIARRTLRSYQAPNTASDVLQAEARRLGVARRQVIINDPVWRGLVELWQVAAR